jgi:hypothetical protein
MLYFVTGVVIGAILLLPIILGEFDVWFTKVDEGQIKVVILGGNAVKYIGVIQGFVCDKSSGVITETAGYKPSKGWFGYHFMHYAPWARIHEYNFKWTKRIGKKGGGNDLELRDEKVNSLFHRYQYPIVVDGLETLDQIKVTITVLVMFQATDASLALFPIANWLDVASGHVRSVVRTYIGQLNYQAITSSDSGNKDLIEGIVKLGDEGPDGDVSRALKTLVGTSVVSAAFDEITAEASADLAQALTAKKVATERAAAEVATAEGHAKAITLIADADSDRIRKVYGAIAGANADGAVGASIRMAEAIQETKVSTLVLGNHPGLVLSPKNS